MEIRQANGDLLAEAGIDLLDDLARLEAALAADSMADRVRRRLGLPTADPVRIEGYRPAYKRHFRQLNELWLDELFSVEDGDRRLLDDPAGRIVRRGGAVFFALVDDEVAGTCALLRHRDQTWELAKMAVAPAVASSRARPAAHPGRHRSRPGCRRQPALVAHQPSPARGRPPLPLARLPPRAPAPVSRDTYLRETIVMVLDLNPNEETAS